jgi:2-methylisocitrate lyase-like PEP mutase family enzyme
VREISSKRESWKAVLNKHRFLPLPVAHDALSARLIELAGFHAYQIGGFALAAILHAVPDVDLEHYGEIEQMVRKIIPASGLPMLIDGDDGYGDAKNVTRTVQGYEFLGASALFLEDQVAPKRCGHMAGKKVVPVEKMVGKLKAAVAARSSDEFFILARTDAIEPHGLDDALMRGEKYLNAGADGIYFEGPRSEEELEIIGQRFQGVPLATSVLERGGKTPNLGFDRFRELGFSMVLYPSTVIFQSTFAIQQGLETLKAGRPIPPERSVTMDEFEQILDIDHWRQIEQKFDPDK